MKVVLEEELPFETLVVNSGFQEFQRSTLRYLLGWSPPLTYANLDTAYQFETLHVPTIRPIGEAIEFLRNIFVELRNHPTQTRSRLFISRADAHPQRVRIRDEDKVYEALRGEGFSRIVLSSLSFEEQVAIFANAEIVVAAHGAALTNMIFAPADCRLIEINNQANASYTFFEVIPQTIGQEFYRLICPGRAAPGFHEEDAEAVVPIATLLRMLQA
jgi:capsular polysaccharide biosynthesis protein